MTHTGTAREVIFVGLPGPTHHYGGLSPDNVASAKHRGMASHPREAALQSLEMMRELIAHGQEVALLPPQLRPDMALLNTKFPGEAEAVIPRAAKEDPALLDAASSSSAMWTANAATVAPSSDTADGKVHLTVANLHTNLHRRIEAAATYRTLKQIFSDTRHFAVHPPLDVAKGQRDEGAANHMRLCPAHGEKGLHVFVYGTEATPSDPPSARQTLAASREVAGLHGLPAEQVLFLRQNPEIIRQGVFHNDVIAESNESVLLCHEAAYEGGAAALDAIRAAYAGLYPKAPLTLLSITRDQLSVAEAVATYFFNSQLVSKPDGRMVMLAPVEVAAHERAHQLLETLRADGANPIDEVRYVDLRQSMQNGGGPACLRLRVVLDDAQIAAVSTASDVMMTRERLDRCAAWVREHYPESLEASGLANPALFRRSEAALIQLSALLRLQLA